MKKIRGIKALVHDAVDKTLELVQEGHDSTARAVLRVAEQVEPLAGPARAIDALRSRSLSGVLGIIRTVNRTVETVSDAGIDLVQVLAGTPDAAAESEADAPAVPMRSDAAQSAGWAGDAALGLVNAAVGDHLQKRKSGLDLGLSFRIGDRYVPLTPQALAAALPQAGQKVALFVHGLATTEWSWCLGAEQYHGDPGVSFGSLLERDLGYTPIWLRYNSGRHVSENGRLLAAALEQLLAAYPVALSELVLVGHSMGGLVVRSACHYGQTDGLGWPALVRRVFCLGSPHRGAPLAKLGGALTGLLGAIDLPGTRIPARLLAGRSAGIKDLRHGAIVDEDWLDRDPDALRSPELLSVPLLPHASYYFISATLTTDPAHPLGQLLGDLLVRVPSGSGPPLRTGSFTISTHGFGGILHHQLQNHPAVYAILRDACAAAPEAPALPPAVQ